MESDIKKKKSTSKSKVNNKKKTNTKAKVKNANTKKVGRPSKNNSKAKSSTTKKTSTNKINKTKNNIKEKEIKNEIDEDKKVKSSVKSKGKTKVESNNSKKNTKSKSTKDGVSVKSKDKNIKENTLVNEKEKIDKKINKSIKEDKKEEKISKKKKTNKTISEEDVVKDSDKKVEEVLSDSKKKRNSIIRYVLILILVIVCVFCGYKLYILGRDTIRNKVDSDKLRREVIIRKPNNQDKPSIKDKEPSIEDIKIDFDTLLNTNKDTVGWMIFNDKLVNNPVVHTTNNSYYLNHTFNRVNSVIGTIFMDYRNNSFSDRNVVLFGHSNLDRSMFGSLNDVFKEGFFDKKDADIIYIFDKDNNLLKYQIFSYYITTSEEYYITTHFSDQSFQVFINTIKSRSYSDRNIEVTVKDKILTLSTCAGAEGTDRRRVIHAKRIN